MNAILSIISKALELAINLIKKAEKEELQRNVKARLQLKQLRSSHDLLKEVIAIRRNANGFNGMPDDYEYYR